MKAFLLKANAGNETQEIVPADGKNFSLKELQDYVGGLIEMVSAKDGRVLIVNEEGKLLGMPFNARASEMYAGADHIVGDAIIADAGLVE